MDAIHDGRVFLPQTMAKSVRVHARTVLIGWLRILEPSLHECEDH